MNLICSRFIIIASTLVGVSLPSQAQEEDVLVPIEIARIERELPVDFSKDIYPLFKKNCIACHNSSKARAQLNLESPKAILKGGSEGPAVVPGKPDESLLLILAAHQEDPVMPPLTNKANAVAFTPEELGLIKLWIAEGAKGESTVIAATPTEWIAPNRNDYPVYHLAMSPNDDYVAAARGTRVFVYDLRRQGLAGELLDPDLANEALYAGRGVTHRDFVQSMAFSKEGWIATGGFRNVKIWQPTPASTSRLASMPEQVNTLAVTPDGQWAASGDGAGNVRLWKPKDSKFKAVEVKAHAETIDNLTFTEDGQLLISSAAKAVTIHETPSLSQRHKLTLESPARGVVASLALRSLLVGADDGNVRVWPFPEIVGESRTHKVSEQGITTLTVMPSKLQHVLVGSKDGQCREWNVGEAKVVSSVKHQEPIRGVAISSDGQRLVTVGEKEAKLWNALDGSAITSLSTNIIAQQTRQAAERALVAANKLVDTRKKKVEEAEKSWKAEIEKAKKAAVEELTAGKAFAEKDQAAHGVRLDAEGPALLEAAEKIKVAQAKKALAEAEVSAKKIGDLKAMAQSLEQTRKEIADTDANLDKESKALLEVRETKEKIRQSLITFRALPDAAEAVHATETLMARSQMDETAALMQVKQRKRMKQALRGKADALHRVVHGVDQAKANVANAEEALKPIAEAAKKASEAANKAESERDAAAKVFKQAEENRELALRLANRASETHGRAVAALVAGEDVAKRRNESVEAAKKSETTRPKLASVCFASDGKTLALALEGGAWQYWSADAGRFLEQQDSHKVNALAQMPDGHWLIGTSDKTVLRQSMGQSWRRRSVIGAIEDPKSLVDRVTSLAFNPSGTVLATGSGSPSRSGELKLWRVSDGAMLVDKSEAHSDTIVGLEFSPDGRYVATASTDRFAKVFRVDDGELVAAFEGHTSHVLDVSWRADGLVVATCGADNVIKLWDFEEKRQMKTIDGYKKEITSVAFADVDETLVTSSGDSSVRLGKDRLDGKEFVYASALSKDGEWVVAGSQDSVVRVWSAKDKKLVKAFGPPGP